MRGQADDKLKSMNPEVENCNLYNEKKLYNIQNKGTTTIATLGAKRDTFNTVAKTETKKSSIMLSLTRSIIQCDHWCWYTVWYG